MNSKIKDLPVTPYLEQICRTLKNSPSRFLVLSAQTGAGKSTAVPLALLENFKGKILMLQPRRLAVTAVANRVADLLDEECGQTAGYTVHLESKTSDETRLEVMTEAVLIRRLQKDPALEGVSVVVLDEFHERTVYTDLALAFLKETMQIRDDLYVILMSATINASKIAAALSDPPSPVMEIPGKLFPVKIIYSDKIDEERAVLKALSEEPGKNEDAFPYRTDTILVFLPGINEINLLKQKLEDTLSNECEILILHSSIPLSAQKKVLSTVSKDSRQRIILSSAIAETSVTVPGIHTVIDSGLERYNRMDIELGMEQLVTGRITQFSADQRAGRAGRLMSGQCIRLWNEHEPLQKELTPQILRSDITFLVLECAKWGSVKSESFSWIDSPSKAAWTESLECLQCFGFIRDDKITQSGSYALELGISPRLGCMALYGKHSGHTKEALQTVLKFSEYSDSSAEIQEKFLKNLEGRLLKCTYSDTLPFTKTELLLSGFPDRLARKLNISEQNSLKKDSTLYQFSSGRKAELLKPYSLAPEYLIAPEVNAGTTARIWSYESLTEKEILPWITEHAVTSVSVNFDRGGQLVKKEITAFGAFVLKEKKLAAGPEDYGLAVCSRIRDEGFSFLPSDEKTLSFLCRTLFYARHKDSSLYTKLESLSSDARTWLLPFITGTKLDSQTLYNALSWYLEGDKIDSEVPPVLTLSNGKKVKINYEIPVSGEKLTTDSLLTNVRSHNISPVIEVIIQQVFGCFENPCILGVPAVLKLLSPARRPLQITSDLKNFWENSWLEICKEMKGRYPKHNWDYRVSE